MAEGNHAGALISRAVDRVAAGDREAFLARLAWELTLAGRTLYPPHSTPEYQAAFPFIGNNELLHRVTEQLRAALGDGTWAAPTDQLIDYLIGHTRAWGNSKTLLIALERTLTALERNDARRAHVNDGGDASPADDR